MKFLRKITKSSMKLFFDYPTYKYVSDHKHCAIIFLLLVTASAQAMNQQYTTDRCNAKRRTNRLPSYGEISFSKSAQSNSSINSDLPDASHNQAAPAPILDDSVNSDTSTSTSSDEDEPASASIESEDLITAQEKDMHQFIASIQKGMTIQQCNKALLEAVIHNKAQRIPILIAAGATDKDALTDYLKIKNKIEKIYKSHEKKIECLDRHDLIFFKNLTYSINNNRAYYPDYSLTLLSVAILNDNKNAIEELLRCQTSKIEDVSLIQSIKDHTTHEILKILIDARANVNELICGYTEGFQNHHQTSLQYNNSRLTPLLLATRNGDVELVQLLVDAGAKICLQDPHFNPETALKTTPHVELAIASRANPKPTSRRFSCYRHVDTTNADVQADIESEKVPTMIDFSPDFQNIFKNGFKKNNAKVVKAAIVAGVNVNVQYKDGLTPLLIAVQQANDPMLKILLAGKADVNKKYSKNNTALLEATKKANVDVVRQLLTANAIVDIQYEANGYTPLLEAVRKNNELMVAILLSANADVNKQSLNGETPLLKATRKKNVAIIKQLLTANAMVDARYSYGSTPLLKAIRYINEPIVKALLAGKADVNLQYLNGETALLEATKRGNVNIVQHLLDAHAIADTANDRGQTPISIAQKMHNHEMVAILETAIKTDTD